MNQNEWVLIQREKASAEANMAMDALLLRRLACVQQPVLHLYDWEFPSITHGYFVDPDVLLSRSGVDRLGVQLARRPTGGGVIIHTCDLTFSVLIPANHPAYTTNTLENYAYINRIVSEAIRGFLKDAIPVALFEKPAVEQSNRPFCMADPTVYDVMIGGKKVAGGAQRRTKMGYLHQGSISLAVPEESFLRLVLREQSIIDAMKTTTYPLAGPHALPSSMLDAKHVMSQLLIENFLNR